MSQRSRAGRNSKEKKHESSFNTILAVAALLVSGLTAGYSDVARFGGYASPSSN